MTPREVAEKYGHSHLFEILSPVILHYLPADVIVHLQERFHSLILNLVGDVVSSVTLFPSAAINICFQGCKLRNTTSRHMRSDGTLFSGDVV